MRGFFIDSDEESEDNFGRSDEFETPDVER